jgi:hypothetical protein
MPSAFGIFLPGFGQSPPRCGTPAKKSGAVRSKRISFFGHIATKNLSLLDKVQSD